MALRRWVVPCLLPYMTGFYVAAGFTFQQILFVSADLQHAALLLSWLVYNQPCSALQRSCNLLTVAAGEARPPAVGTTAQPYTAGRLPFFVTAVRKSASEVPLRFIDALRSAPDIVRSQPRTASLLSGNSVLLLSSNQAGRLRRGSFLCFKDSAPGGREESPPRSSPQRVSGTQAADSASTCKVALCFPQ